MILGILLLFGLVCIVCFSSFSSRTRDNSRRAEERKQAKEEARAKMQDFSRPLTTINYHGVSWAEPKGRSSDRLKAYARRLEIRSELFSEVPPLDSEKAADGFTTKTVFKNGRSRLSHSAQWQDAVKCGSDLEDDDVAWKEISWVINR